MKNKISPVIDKDYTLQVTKKEYFPALDGLRAVAVLVVLLAHGSTRLWPTELQYRGGWLGVQIFFVLSGFLITSLLLKERLKTGRISLPSFWTRRALRIWPLYYVVLLSYAFVLPHFHKSLFAGMYVSVGAPGWEEYRASLWPFFIFLQNYFAHVADVRLGLGIFWSLAIEEHFYLFWPLLVAFLKPKHLGLAAAGILVASFTLRTFAIFGFLPVWNGVERMTHTDLDAIALGSLVACMYILRREWVLRVARYQRLIALASVATLGIIFASGWANMPFAPNLRFSRSTGPHL